MNFPADAAVQTAPAVLRPGFKRGGLEKPEAEAKTPLRMASANEPPSLQQTLRKKFNSISARYYSNFKRSSNTQKGEKEGMIRIQQRPQGKVRRIS